MPRSSFCVWTTLLSKAKDTGEKLRARDSNDEDKFRISARGLALKIS